MICVCVYVRVRVQGGDKFHSPGEERLLKSGGTYFYVSVLFSGRKRYNYRVGGICSDTSSQCISSPDLGEDFPEIPYAVL